MQRFLALKLETGLKIYLDKIVFNISFNKSLKSIVSPTWTAMSWKSVAVCIALPVVMAEMGTGDASFSKHASVT